jgi:dUTP pyrophosphatase
MGMRHAINQLVVKIKKTNPNAVVPEYAKVGDACVDLVAVEKFLDDFGNTCYNTGLAFEIPFGFAGLVYPRSSISKTDMTLRNCVGVIDSGYRGPVVLKFREYDNSLFNYKIGDRIGQLMIVPHPQVEFAEVDELSDSDRGDGGFGSTGS